MTCGYNEGHKNVSGNEEECGCVYVECTECSYSECMTQCEQCWHEQCEREEEDDGGGY
jgi:hypothetical protein